MQQGHRDDQHDNDRSKLEEVFRNEFNLRIGTFSSTVRAEFDPLAVALAYHAGPRRLGLNGGTFGIDVPGVLYSWLSIP